MGVVKEPVEDGVAEGGVTDDIVPVVDGDLAGEQRAAAGVAVGSSGTVAVVERAGLAERVGAAR